MRSSAILVAALVGVASAGMPNSPLTWLGTASDVSGGGVGPTGKPPLDHGPALEKPHTGGMFPTGHRKAYPMKEHTKSGGMFPSGGPKEHHPEKHHRTGSGKYRKPTGSGIGPTGTGNGASPASTSGPLTTTITTTSDVTSTVTSTLYDTTTLTSTITKYVPCSSPIATAGTSTYYSTSLTTTYSVTTVTQTSTTYQVICPSTTSGAGSPPAIPFVPTGGSIVLESPGTAPTSTPVGGESGGVGGATNTAYGSMPTLGSGPGGYSGIPGSPSNGCPAVQTVTSTLQVTVTVTSTAGAGESGSGNAPFSTQAGTAPFPLPSGSGSAVPFPSGTGASTGLMPSGGYQMPTAWAR